MIPNCTDPIETTELSLEIVEYVKSNDGATLSEIVDYTGRSRSTIHNHLKTLEKHGYVCKSGPSYHLGIKLYNLGMNARRRDPRYRIAKQAVTELSKKTGEEVDFSIAEHGLMTVIHLVTPGDEQNPSFKTGEQYYMHSSAIGKAILAHLPEADVAEIIDNRGLPGVAQNTITAREDLFDELERVRRRGYSESPEEFRDGLWSVGTAVRDPNDEIFGGISINIPIYRISDKDKERLIDLIKQTQKDLEEELVQFT